MAAAGAGLTSLAANLGEARNLAQVTFGDSSKAVEDFAATADTAFGLTEEAALQYAGTLGVIIDGSIDNQAAAADMSIELLKVAADLSSINNIPIDVALEKLRAGLVGETEPLRTVGVLLSDQRVRLEAVRLGLARTTKEVDDASKVQARYSLILRDTERAQGDFARTSRDLPNLLRRTRAAFGNLAAEIGQELLPVATELVQNVFDWMIRNRQEIVRFARDGIGRIVDFARKAADVAGRLRLALADYWSANGDRLVENFKALADAATSFAAALGKFVSQNADKLTALFRFIADNASTILAVLGARIALGRANDLTGGVAGGLAQGAAQAAGRAAPALLGGVGAAAALPVAIVAISAAAAAVLGREIIFGENREISEDERERIILRSLPPIVQRQLQANRTAAPGFVSNFSFGSNALADRRAANQAAVPGFARNFGGGPGARSLAPSANFSADLFEHLRADDRLGRLGGFGGLGDLGGGGIGLGIRVESVIIGSREFRIRGGGQIPELDFLAAMGIPPEIHIRANIIRQDRLTGNARQAFSESFATTRNALAAADPDLALFGGLGGLSDPGASAERRRGFAQESGALDPDPPTGGGGFRFVIEATDEWRAALERVREINTVIFGQQVAIVEQEGIVAIAVAAVAVRQGEVAAAQDVVTAATKRYAEANDAVAAKRRQIGQLDREILENQLRLNRAYGVSEATLDTAEIESHLAAFRLGLLEESAARAGGIENVTEKERDRIDEVVAGAHAARAAELELNSARAAAAATQGQVSALQRADERAGLVEQAVLLEDNAEIARGQLRVAQTSLETAQMQLGHSRLVLENEEFLLEALNAELVQRVLLQTQAGLLLEIVGQEQRIERDITLDYVERSRILDGIISKRREVELIDIRTRDLRRELARQAKEAATRTAAAGNRGDGGVTEVEIFLDGQTIAKSTVANMQKTRIRGTPLGIT